MENKGRKVLIAMDGSKHSDFAFQFYTQQLRHEDDYIILAHCFERHAGLHSAMGTADIQSVCNIMQEEDAENQKFQKEMNDKLSQAGLMGCVKGKFGKPGEVIVSLAAENHANMIVCGSRGIGKVRRTLMGSVSDYIVHHSEVPVVVCRHKDHHHH